MSKRIRQLQRFVSRPTVVAGEQAGDVLVLIGDATYVFTPDQCRQVADDLVDVAEVVEQRSEC